MGNRKTTNSSKTAQKTASTILDASQGLEPVSTNPDPTPSVTDLISVAIAEAPQAGQFPSET